MTTLVRNFRRGLKMNLHVLNARQRALYRCVVRPFASAEEREFFEGIPSVAGQLYRAERHALYDAIVARAPKYGFEIGTFNGGGSTYFSAKAFAKLGHGKLVTLRSMRHSTPRPLSFTRTSCPHCGRTWSFFMEAVRSCSYHSFTKPAPRSSCFSMAPNTPSRVSHSIDFSNHGSVLEAS